MRKWGGEFPRDAARVGEAKSPKGDGKVGGGLFDDVGGFAGEIVIDDANGAVWPGDFCGSEGQIVFDKSLTAEPIGYVRQAIEAIVIEVNGAITRINDQRVVAVCVIGVLD